MVIVFLVYCPEGWYSSKGYCLKAVLSSSGLKYADANKKCEDLGGFILEPMNEMYTQDLEEVLTNYTKNSNESAWWIGQMPLIYFFKVVF